MPGPYQEAEERRLALVGAPCGRADRVASTSFALASALLVEEIVGRDVVGDLVAACPREVVEVAEVDDVADAGAGLELEVVAVGGGGRLAVAPRRDRLPSRVT
jgi:hypothetical protein